MSVTVEIQGLEVFGHHGVEEDERRDGQRFLYDVDFDVAETVLSDRIDDAVMPANLARVGGMNTGEHLDQGRFAGAVLAEQAVHLAVLHRQRDVVIRKNPGKLLGDADELDGGRVGRVLHALAAGRSACRGGRFATERFRAKPLVLPRRPPEAAAAPLGAFLEPGDALPGGQQPVLERILGILERSEHPVAVHL